jgi:hypothetical protein
MQDSPNRPAESWISPNRASRLTPSSGGHVGGCRFERAHYEPPILMDALDRVSAELELAQDGGREVDPAGS